MTATDSHFFPTLIGGDVTYYPNAALCLLVVEKVMTIRGKPTVGHLEWKSSKLVHKLQHNTHECGGTSWTGVNL
jgi:hypothetical protein